MKLLASSFPPHSLKRVREAFRALRAVHVAVRGELGQQVATLRRVTEEGRGPVSGRCAVGRVGGGGKGGGAGAVGGRVMEEGRGPVSGPLDGVQTRRAGGKRGRGWGQSRR